MLSTTFEAFDLQVTDLRFSEDDVDISFPNDRIRFSNQYRFHASNSTARPSDAVLFTLIAMPEGVRLSSCQSLRQIERQFAM